MEFALSEEQKMIRDTAESFLSDKSDSAAVRAAMVSELGYEKSLWDSICQEMYWHAVHIPEEYGGLGLGYVEVAVVMEQMGRRLLCSPYFATVALAVNALLLAGDERQKTDWLTKIIEGSTASLAFNSGGNDWSAHAVSAHCTKQADGFELNGEYHYVVDGHTADFLIVAARGTTDNNGVSLFIVPSDTKGLTREWTPSMDQTRKLAKLTLDKVVLSNEFLLGAEGDSAGVLQAVIDLGLVALAAEQCGGANAILDQAVSYSLERQQFGRSIAGFQSIKHKAADMKLKAEVSRSAVYYAACVAQELLAGSDGDQTMAAELPEAASMAKAYCSETYFFNAGSALQIHGGVGFTWEYDVHLYFKRAKSSESLLGNAAWHKERIAGLLLDHEQPTNAEVSS